MNSGLVIAGIDGVCAVLTLVYIARLLLQSLSISNPIAASCCVSKVSLRDQQVARRLR
jgi:hypothetical protein